MSGIARINELSLTPQIHQPDFEDERSQNSDLSQDSEQEVAVHTMGEGEATSTSGAGNVVSPEKANNNVSEEESVEATLEPKEIGEWFEQQFNQITHADTSQTGADYLLMERTITDTALYFLMMSDTQEHLQVVYGLAKVPTSHQMADQPQVTAFFAPRKVEVPSTMYIGVDEATKTEEMFFPTLEQVEAAIAADPTIKLVKIDEGTMSKAVLPALMPIPKQWADELDQKLMNPMQALRWFNRKISGWDEVDTTKLQPFKNWIHAACTRLVNGNEAMGSAVQQNWRLFTFKTNEGFKWASKRLDVITSPWAKVSSTAPEGPSPPNSQWMNQLLQILSQQSTIMASLSLPTNRTGPAGPPTFNTAKPTNTFSENQMARLLGWCGLKWTEQHLLPPLWNELLAETDSVSKLTYLQMKFSAQSTGDPDLAYQITEQIVKDLSKLYLGRGMDYDYETCHHGMSPFCIVPLSIAAHRERESEERARAMATQTTVSDHRKKRKYVPKIALTFDALRMFLKCWRFWLHETMGERSIKYIRVKMLEEAYIKHYMHVKYLDPETILSIIWTLFLDARCFYGVAISKAQLMDPDGIRPESPSILGLVQSMQAGFIGRRDDIPWEWRKEYLQRDKGGLSNGNTNGTPNGYPSSNSTNGGRQRGGAGEMRGRLHPRIQQTLQPIFDKYGMKLKLRSLLTYAGTNVNDMLGPEYANHCGKSFLLGKCVENCTKQHNWNPPNPLVNRIISKISPGIAQYVRNGPN
jgi:hypothetical protein